MHLYYFYRLNIKCEVDLGPQSGLKNLLLAFPLSCLRPILLLLMELTQRVYEDFYITLTEVIWFVW